MPRWLKITLVSIAVLLLVATGAVYGLLKYRGTIPSHDYEVTPPNSPIFPSQPF